MFPFDGRTASALMAAADAALYANKRERAALVLAASDKESANRRRHRSS